LLFKLQWAIGFSPRRTDDPLHFEEQRVPRTPASPSLARSHGGLWPRPPRYGIHEYPGWQPFLIENDYYYRIPFAAVKRWSCGGTGDRFIFPTASLLTGTVLTKHHN